MMDDVLAVSAGRPDRRVSPSANGDREQAAGRFEDVIGAAGQGRVREDGRSDRATSGPHGGRDRSADVAARSAEAQPPARPGGQPAGQPVEPSEMPAAEAPAKIAVEAGTPEEPANATAAIEMAMPVAVPPPAAPQARETALPMTGDAVVAAVSGGMRAVAGSHGPAAGSHGPAVGPPSGILPVPARPGAGEMTGEAAGKAAGEAEGQPVADAGSIVRTVEAKGPAVRAGADQPKAGGGPTGQPVPSADVPAAGTTKGPVAFLTPAVAEYTVQSPGGGPDIGPATGPRANVPAAATQVAEQLVRVVQPGRNQFQIDLTPAELGRVRIEADVTEGRVTLLVQAERAETLDLLRADVRVLERALGDAGLKFDPASVQFSLRGDDQPRGFTMSGGGAQDRHRDGGDGGPGGRRPDAGDPAAEPVRVAIDGIVDLIV